MLRQGILNSHNDFVYNYWIDGSWKWFNLVELAARTGVYSDHEIPNTDIIFSIFFFGIRYFSVFRIPISVSISVFWNTSVFGIGIGYLVPQHTNIIIFVCCASTYPLPSTQEDWEWDYPILMKLVAVYLLTTFIKKIISSIVSNILCDLCKQLTLLLLNLY